MGSCRPRTAPSGPENSYRYSLISLGSRAFGDRRFARRNRSGRPEPAADCRPAFSEMRVIHPELHTLNFSYEVGGLIEAPAMGAIHLRQRLETLEKGVGIDSTKKDPGCWVSVRPLRIAL